MPLNPDSKRGEIAALAKQIADHQARIQVIAANWGAEITGTFNAGEKAFLSKLAKELKNFEFNYNALETLTRLKKICRELESIRAAAFARAQEKVTAEANALADNEAKWAKRVTKELSEPGAKFIDPTAAALEKVVKFGLASGATLQEYFTKVAADDAVRIESTIRQGVESGWTIDQIARNIAGSAANDYKDGIFETTRRSAINMARTLTNSIANNAKDAFYRANTDVLEGVEILATLDGRTCPVCASLDRTRYKFDEPHPALPIHHQCRCVLLPVTPLSDLVEEQRPMAKADFMKEAERLYKEKYPKKDFSALADSTRKKYYYEAMREYEKRTGQPAYTQVSGSVTFKEYFEKHMTAQQQKDWLGPERYKLYKDFKLPLDRFIPPYPDKRMTIAELKAQDKASFAVGAVSQAKGERLHKSTMIFPDQTTDYPAGGKYKKLKPYYNAALNGEKQFVEKLQSVNPDVEFAGVWDADKNLFCVSMGEGNHVSYKVPLNGAVVIHNHPLGTPPSWRDFQEFAEKNLIKMEIITAKGRFRLTNTSQNVKLPIEKIKARFFNIIGERDHINLKEWEEVLNGSGYGISFVDSR